MISHLTHVLSCVAFLAASACSGGTGASDVDLGDHAGPRESGGADIDGNAAPTWTRLYADVISNQCPTCHYPSGIGVSLGRLDMSSPATAYESLVNTPAAGDACAGHGVRLTPDEPDASILYLKVSLDNPPCGARMPLGGPALSDAQLSQIRDWIKAGASND